MGTSPFNGNRVATTARSFHGQIFAELTPLARKRRFQQGYAGQKNQIEWRPEFIEIGVINFRCGSISEVSGGHENVRCWGYSGHCDTAPHRQRHRNHQVVVLVPLMQLR